MECLVLIDFIEKTCVTCNEIVLDMRSNSLPKERNSYTKSFIVK